MEKQFNNCSWYSTCCFILVPKFYIIFIFLENSFLNTDYNKALSFEAKNS